MARRTRPRSLSDDELLHDLVEELVQLMCSVAPYGASCGPLMSLADEHRRRQRKYRKEHGPRCTCWVCYRPFPEGIHPDDGGPF